MSLLFQGQSRAGAKQVSISWTQKFVSFWLNHLRQCISSLGDIARTPMASLMTISVLGLSMTLPATFYVLVKNAGGIADNWSHASEISLFLDRNLNEVQTQQFVDRVRLYTEVDSVSLITKAQALEEFKDASGFGDALAYLPNNPLPAVAVVIPSMRHASPVAARQLLNKLEQEKEVDLGKLDVQWLERLQALINLAKDVVSAVAVLLFVSVVLIVGNTIRLAILSKKSEIEVMKLVGATEAFIQRPFLYTGAWYGVLGSVIAYLSISLLILWLESAFKTMASLYDKQLVLDGLSFSETVMVALLSIALGWVGSWISVKRHISEIEPG